MSENRYGPSFHLATFHERVSSRGTRYFAGRLGHCKAALLPGEPTADGTPTWRRDGTIPWKQIGDRLRLPRHVSMWDGLGDFATTAAGAYRRDL